MHLKRYLEGIYTPQDIEVFNRLLVEANNQLNVIKIPSSYQKYANYIRGLNINLLETTNQMSLNDLLKELTKLESLKVVSETEDKIRISGLRNEEGTDLFSNSSKGLSNMVISELSGKPIEITDKDIEIEENATVNTNEKIFSVILGDEGDIPEDLKSKNMEELEEIGGEVLTEFDVQSFADGRLDMDSLSEEKKQKFMQILELMKEGPKDVDNFSDDDEK